MDNSDGQFINTEYSTKRIIKHASSHKKIYTVDTMIIMLAPIEPCMHDHQGNHGDIINSSQ